MAASLQSSLRLAPGAAAPVSGVRAPLAQRLLQGRPGPQAPLLLGSLYALCGQAHRVCAQLALDALAVPAGARVRPRPEQRLALWRETVREHARRVLLDWPRLLGQGGEPDVLALATCPAQWSALHPGDLALGAWLEQQVLGMPVARWLQGCQQNPGKWLLQWAHETPTTTAQLLLGAWPLAGAWPLPPQALELDAGGEVLRQLAQSMRADAGFTSQPRLGGRCQETGCWSRAGAQALAVTDVWTRLAARVHDLARLAQDTGCGWLRAGAQALGAGEAVAWCEMSRGVLVHWLRMDSAGGIERYGVLAPTEWNFHPQGVVAQTLRQLPGTVAPQDIGPAVDLLVAAFDPCVDHELVEAQTPAQERGAHA